MREACRGAIHDLCAQNCAAQSHHKREEKYEQETVGFNQGCIVAGKTRDYKNQCGCDRGVIYRAEKENIF